MKKYFILLTLLSWFIATSEGTLQADSFCLRCPSFPLDNSVMVGNGALWMTEPLPDSCAIQWSFATESFSCASSGAPVNATYLVVSLDGTLTNERNFTCGSGLTCTDSGANAPFTVSMTAGPSGWTDSGSNVRLTTSTDLVGIGTTSAETEALNIFGNIGFSSSASSAPDLFLTRSAANDLKLGKDAATASGQFIRAPDSSAGTGAGLTLAAGDGSGANTGGSINFQTAQASGIPATRWLIQASTSAFRPNIDNTYDIGSTSAAVHDLFMGNEIDWNSDLFLSRDAAATLQLGVDAGAGTAQTIAGPNGTSTTGGALTVRGGTGTTTGGNLTLAAGDGTGANASGIIILQTAAASASLTNRWQISTSGHLLASTDNAVDIGASGATRPRDLFVADQIMVGADQVTPRVSITGSSDQVQFFTQAHSTQTSDIIQTTTSGGTNLFRVTNTGVKIGGTNAATILNGLTGTASIDFADPGSNACTAESSITVTGATTGAACFLGVPNVANIGQYTFQCRISASNTCSAKACKHGSTAADPGSGTYRCVVLEF